jgi:hypothetical protein
MNDAALLNTGFEYLTEKLGMVEAERFISLVLRTPFDYTEWREHLFDGMTARELSNKAMEYRNK